jgi:hypothetical protein
MSVVHKFNVCELEDSLDRSMNNDRKRGAAAHENGYLSSPSIDDSYHEEASARWPTVPKNAARQSRPVGGAANAPKSRGGYKNNATAAATFQPTKKNGGGPQCTRDKENNNPGLAKCKRGRSKSLTNEFGRGAHHKHQGRMRTHSPPGKPMILSRRLSYRINNATPGRSPVAATKLLFSPIVRVPATKKSRTNHHQQSSLERLASPKPSKPSKRSNAAHSKRRSV